MTLLAAVALIVVGLPLSRASDGEWLPIGCWCLGAAFAFALDAMLR